MVAKSLRAAGYSGEIWGMGAIESRQAGVRCDWAGEKLQLFGLTEVVSAIPSIFRLMNEVVDRIIHERPACVVVADSPDYHMRLIKKLRSKGYGGKIFYISPPSVWAWRSSRADDLRAYTDECLPLFEFEHRFLQERGCNSYWIGHPLLEEFSRRMPEELPPELKDDDRIVAFLPGSRRSEVTKLMPVMEETAANIAANGWHPVFSIAPGLNPEARMQMQERFRKNGFRYYDGPGRDLMRAARCAIAASGTITVESLLLNCYMVVTYKLNAFSAMIGRMVVKTKHYAMANILYGSQIFPEFLQENATSDNLTQSALAWLEAPQSSRDAIYEKMEQARQLLGKPGVYEYWADRIMRGVCDA